MPPTKRFESGAKLETECEHPNRLLPRRAALLWIVFSRAHDVAKSHRLISMVSPLYFPQWPYCWSRLISYIVNSVEPVDELWDHY